MPFVENLLHTAIAEDSGSSDSDDDKKRVVKSHRDKKWDQMKEMIEDMKNHIKINDWCALRH